MRSQRGTQKLTMERKLVNIIYLDRGPAAGERPRPWISDHHDPRMHARLLQRIGEPIIRVLSARPTRNVVKQNRRINAPN